MSVQREVRRLAAKRLERRQKPMQYRERRPVLKPVPAPSPTKKYRNASWQRGKSNRLDRGVKGTSWRGGFNLILK